MAISPRTWLRPCSRRPASSPPTFWRRSTRSAITTARRSRTAPSPRRPAGRKPTAPGRKPAGTGSRRLSNGAARRCRMRLNAACIEMWNSAAMAFGLGPLLTMAGIDALAAHGSEALKHGYLSKLVSGEWMGTMQLTEPQAGSDVGALAHPRRARRRRQLSHHRPEDLHHLWRARPHRQHHPLRAGAAARRAARHARHLAVPGAEIPAQRGRLARRAQRRARTFDRAQARHPCLADLHHGVRRRMAARPASSSARRTAAWPACSP